MNSMEISLGCKVVLSELTAQSVDTSGFGTYG